MVSGTKASGVIGGGVTLMVEGRRATVGVLLNELSSSKGLAIAILDEDPIMLATGA